MAIESFLRCAYDLPKQDDSGKKIIHDYESYLDQYLKDENRNQSADITAFSQKLAKESKSSQSARQILTYAAKFLRAHGVAASHDDVLDMKREMKGGAPTVAEPLDGDKICQALRGSNVRDRAIILTLASSGMRIGEALSLDMSDIKLDETPVRIIVRAAKAKNKHPRFTFCSNEARDAIKVWLKNRDAFLLESSKHNQNLIAINGEQKYEKDSKRVVKSAPVKTTSNLLFPVSDNQINSAWETLLRKAGLFQVDSETKRNIYRLHSLRRFFDTRLGTKTGMKEKMIQYFMGHLSQLENKYYVPELEDAREQYLKAQDALICCVPEEARSKIRTLEKITAELEETTEGLKEDKETQKEANQLLRSKAQAVDDQAKEIDAMKQQINVLATSLNRLMDMMPDDFKLQFKKDAAHGKLVSENFQENK